ncbi:MAG: hypothetical protein FWC99_00815, partial [Coriobacteriia bacterium]|nr:hypothetical protein [Coriobacteriia bacterium]
LNLSRFISRDTVLGTPEDPRTHNLYVYVANDPLNHIDPSGHTSMQLRFQAPRSTIRIPGRVIIPTHHSQYRAAIQQQRLFREQERQWQAQQEAHRRRLRELLDEMSAGLRPGLFPGASSNRTANEQRARGASWFTTSSDIPARHHGQNQPTHTAWVRAGSPTYTPFGAWSSWRVVISGNVIGGDGVVQENRQRQRYQNIHEQRTWSGQRETRAVRMRHTETQHRRTEHSGQRSYWTTSRWQRV